MNKYRKRRNRWKNGNRYGQFVAAVRAEGKKKAELLEARTHLVNVLAQVADKKSDEYWTAEKAVLEKLRSELLDLGKVPSFTSSAEVIKYCVNFFDIVSRAQDALPDGVLHVAPANKQNAADAFNNDIYYSGRHTIYDLRKDSVHGEVPFWNTTLRGTPITEETIMFGPDIGLSAKPASYWLKLPKSKKVYVIKTTTYAKGHLSKKVAVWATDALVQTGVHKFCKTATTCLLSELNELLGE